MIKDRNIKEVTKMEQTENRWQEYIELYEKRS